MARPKSDDKRSAILAAATRVFVKQGLSAPTAVIAKEAGIANGSLFTYFKTKSDLIDQLYLDLKLDMANSSLKGLPVHASTKDQFAHVWGNWMRWSAANPNARRAIAILGVSDDVTPETRAAGHQAMAGIAMLMEKGRAGGPMKDAPIQFVAGIMNSIAEATMDFISQDPKHAEGHSKTGFEALWRMLHA
ncbi:MAG: TetR/AcrR family transcriptional regulator [Archangium sp.]